MITALLVPNLSVSCLHKAAFRDLEWGGGAMKSRIRIRICVRAFSSLHTYRFKTQYLILQIQPAPLYFWHLNMVPCSCMFFIVPIWHTQCLAVSFAESMMGRGEARGEHDCYEPKAHDANK
jgi:hypothetical protein